MRKSPALLLLCCSMWMACRLHANVPGGDLPFDPLAGLDPCARALVTRLVLDQKLPLSHNHFHRVENTFEKLGIRFDHTEHEDIPIVIDENLVSYEALSIHRVYRGDVVTEYISVETRIGAPGILAQRVNAKAFWHSDANGFFGVLEGPRAHHGQTRGAAELQRIWLHNAGSTPALREEIFQLSVEGQRRQQAIAQEALDFYLRNLVRRSWSDETKQRLSREFFASLRNSVLSVSRLRSTGEIVGTLQIIRAPYGRRLEVRERSGELEIVRDEVGAWGDSVRKFGIKTADVHYLSNQELYDRMDKHRDPDGELPMIRTPAEIKLREQGTVLQRNCLPDTSELQVINGEELTVFWASGEVDEPARLAVDRSQNPRLFVEVLTQLLSSAVDPHFSMEYNSNNRFLLTYNDRPSLYYGANFRPSGKFLIIDGKPWPVLVTDGAGHIEALQRMTRPLTEGDAKSLETIKRAVLLYMDSAP